MIIALLFLILFALLFPKALKFLLALAFIGGIVVLSEAHAEQHLSFRAAVNFCIENPDARENGYDEHLLSIKECAARIVKTQAHPDEMFVSTKYLVAYWYSLDEGCRGASVTETKTQADTDQACDKRLAVDKILKDHGCRIRYPKGWPELNGEYWKCS